MNFSIAQKAFFFSCIILTLASAPAIAKSAPKFTGTIKVEGKSKSEYSSLTKISLQEAIAIGLKQSPGKVVEAVLEKEGEYLIYEVEIQTPDHNKKEFVIDPGDGKVLLVKDREPSSKDDKDDDND